MSTEDTDSLRVRNERYRWAVLLEARARQSLAGAEMSADTAAKVQALPNEHQCGGSGRTADTLGRDRQGAGFVAQVLRYLDRGIGAPNYQRYVSYALSTTERGRAVASLVSKHRPLAGARYLDVGTGWGGYLVAFAEQGVAGSVGIEVDEALAKAAETNIREHGLTAQVILGDVGEPSTTAELGPFDIITCDDVIEHVAQPDALIATLSRLCAESGLVVLNIPNKLAYACVLSDPHHGLFGSVLLSPEDMRRQFFELYPPSAPYLLGEFWPLDLTLERLRQNGLDPFLVKQDVPCNQEAMEAIRDGCRQVRDARHKAEQDSRLSQDVSKAVLDAVDTYLAVLGEDLDRFVSSGGKPGTPAARELSCRYYPATHRLLCFKRRPSGWRHLLRLARGPKTKEYL